MGTAGRRTWEVRAGGVEVGCWGVSWGIGLRRGLANISCEVMFPPMSPWRSPVSDAPGLRAGLRAVARSGEGAAWRARAALRATRRRRFALPKNVEHGRPAHRLRPCRSKEGATHDSGLCVPCDRRLLRGRSPLVCHAPSRNHGSVRAALKQCIARNARATRRTVSMGPQVRRTRAAGLWRIHGCAAVAAKAQPPGKLLAADVARSQNDSCEASPCGVAPLCGSVFEPFCLRRPDEL